MARLPFGRQPALTIAPRRGMSTFVGAKERQIKTAPHALLDSQLIANLNRGEERSKPKIKVGDVVHNYKLKEKEYFPERNLEAYHFTHVKTGAKHLHIDCADTNNVCLITFKTSPQDSRGVAHVLEHTALCGSESYPIRDPFFNMYKRSLQTYMNAWTGPDYTSYPFSTYNPKDFYNLLSVYLDSAFFPNLNEMDFKQEGHRLEFADAEDPKSGLEIKGIVFNEMKGAMAESSQIFMQKLSEKLFPSVTYNHNSGGDPENIPDLTYEHLVEFHHHHYHPSNSYTATYGDLPVQLHLEAIDTLVMQRFDPIQPDTEVPFEKRYTTPQQFSTTGPPSTMGTSPENDCKLIVSYLMTPSVDSFTTTALQLLTSLLMNGPNSPMYKALIESNLGKHWAPGTGFEDSLKETLFSIGLQGINEKDKEQVEQLVFETLEKIAEEGFPQERINAALHQMELSLRHVTSDFGLELVAGLSHSWIHGGSPVENLSLPKVMREIRQEIERGPFFQNLIKTQLLNNPHRVTLFMSPDESYSSKLQTREKEKVQKIERSLSEEDKRRILQDSRDLLQHQDEPQDVTLLPLVSLDDIPLEIRKEKVVGDLGKHSVPVHFAPCPTNELIYLRLLFDSSKLPQELVPYVPIFCSLLPGMGAGDMDYRQVSQAIEELSGGISLVPSIHRDHTDVSQSSPRITLNMFSLKENFPRAVQLLTDLCTKPSFSNIEHIRTLLEAVVSSSQDGLLDKGHAYAMSYAASYLSPHEKGEELWSGLTQYKFLQHLLTEGDIDVLAQKMSRIAQILFASQNLRILVNSEEPHFAETRASLDTLIQALPTSFEGPDFADKHPPLFPSPETSNTYIGVPVDTHHSALVLPNVPYTDPAYTHSVVLGTILTNVYLHREIREKGGAYGGGASGTPGRLSFYSYRDPNTTATIQHFKNSLDTVSKGNFSEDSIMEAKLTYLSTLDSPVAPQDVGYRQWSTGVTDEMRQRNRDRLREITQDHIRECASSFLNIYDTGSCAVFGDSAAKAEFAAQDNWNYLE